MKLDDATFDRWVEWANAIRVDITRLTYDKLIFDGFQDIVSANVEHIAANSGGVFCHFVRRCYAAKAALGVRRHLKKRRGEVSLMHLMDQIRKCADQFTYDFYLSKYPRDEDNVEWQKSTFRRFSHDGEKVAAEVVEQDIKSAEDIGAAIESLVDRQWAHMDKRGFDGKVTFSHLGSTIGLFDKLACKYLLLVTGGESTTLRPAMSSDWEAIFRVPINSDIQRAPTVTGNDPPSAPLGGPAEEEAVAER